MVNAPIAMRKSLDTLHGDAVEELRSEILAADDELRGHLKRVLGGSIRNRVIGVVLDRRHDCLLVPARASRRLREFVVGEGAFVAAGGRARGGV